MIEKIVRAATCGWRYVGNFSARHALRIAISFAMVLAASSDPAQAGCISGRCSAPSLSITGPANNASFRVAENITLIGRAYGDVVIDAIGDGHIFPISRVEIYKNGSVVGTATLGASGVDANDVPFRDYSYTFAGGFVAAGSYTIGAKPYDSGSNLGAGAGSTVTIGVTIAANSSPTVSITSPANGSVLTVGNPIRLSATAADSDGTVVSVQYFDSTNAISGTLTTFPYSYTWTAAALVSGGIRAVATDNNGAKTTSQAIVITINDKPTSQLNVSNVITQNPGSITLTTTASDSVGGVDHVQYLRNNVVQPAILSNPPFAQTWTSVPPGTYTIVARVFDTYGVWTDSAPYTWVVNAAPSVSISAPSTGTISNAPGSFNFTAAAFDTDGVVSNVQWFANGTAISGALPSAPYAFPWGGVASGSYTITARATDNAGGVATSAPITVVSNDAPLVTLTASNVVGVAPGNVKLQSGASDAQGGVTSLQYFANGNPISGVLTVAPYDFTWTSVAAGSYNITARATDGFGLTGSSSPYGFNVNAPPSINITSPSVGSVLLAPSSVAFTVNAADADGLIASVQYYLNGSALGAPVTVAPFSYAWASPPPGVYALTARATDSGGATTVSAAVSFTVNDRPVVSLNTSAVNGLAPGSITLQATASDSQGGVANVQYFANGLPISGVLTNSPYLATWSSVASGSYSVVARVTDTYNVTGDSAPFPWVVNQAPTVSLTTPANGTIVNTGVPAVITLAANAADSDGGIAKVEFLVNSVVVATSTASPFVGSWTANAAGAYSLQARATDSSGAVTTSGISLVSIDAPPTATITSPSNGATFQPGWDIPVTVSAADSDGIVAKVEIYDGASLIATLNSAPYAFTMADVPAGTHTLTAKAYDNQSAISTSAAVTINVVFNAPPVSSGSGIPGKLNGALAVSSGGAAQYAIPIVAPPGAAGMTPNIALKYDSGGGNGVAGVGWSISGLSQITRCGRDFAHEGITAGVDLTTDDRFCLDGQRLIFIGGVTRTNPFGEYRTEIDSFTKIIGVDRLGNGPTSFTATLRDGTKIEFGTTADAVWVLPGHSTPIAWSVNKVTDARSNFYTVTYATVGATGQQLPSRIDYTGNGIQSLSPSTGAIVFAYDQTRTDIDTRYVVGAKISNTSRLASIKTYSGATLVKDYRVTYDVSASTARSRIQSITECADAGSTCLAPTTFNWENTPVSFNGPQIVNPHPTVLFAAFLKDDPANPAGDPANAHFVKSFRIDINGDGRPDFCAANKFEYPESVYWAEELLCALTQPNGAPPLLVKVGLFAAGSSYAFIDVDGDGILDVCSVYCVLMSLTGPKGIVDNPSGYIDRNNAVLSLNKTDDFIDINGDGLADFCTVTRGSIVTDSAYWLQCQLRTTNGYSAPVNLGALSVPSCNNITCQELQFAWADVSGDGVPSFCRMEAGAMRCRKWTPAGLAPEISTDVGIDMGENTGGRAWVDVNGDGKADFCRVISNTPGLPSGPGHVACTLSTGTGFGETIVSGTIEIGYGTPQQKRAADWVDVNGDGKADYCIGGICVLSTGTAFASSIATPSGTVRYDASGDGKPDACGMTGCQTSGGTFFDLLLGVTDGLGATTGLDYRPISDAAVYTKGSGAVFPTVDLQDPTHVVQRVRTSNGVGGSIDTAYTYEGAKAHLQGRGFLGFAAMNGTGPTGTVSRNETRQDFPFIGVSKRSLVSNGGVTLSDTTITHAATASAPYKVYPVNTVAKAYDLNGAFINWVESATPLASYDAYGNPTQVDTVYKNAAGALDGYSQTSVMAYSNNTSNWILGLPTSLTTISRVPGKPDGTRVLNSSYGIANPGLGLLQQSIVEPNNGGLAVANLRLVTDYTYDVFGNVLTKTVSGANIATRIDTTNTYDATGRGPISVRNALNHIETRVYDWRYGVMTSLQGPNLLSTSWTYDLFGRQATEDRADGTRTTIAYNPCAACVPGSAYSIARTETVIGSGANVSPPSRAYYDTLGRTILSAQSGLAGQDIYRETLYDSLGRIGYASLSYFATDARIRWTQYTFDALGRSTQTLLPDNTATTASYNGRTTSVSNHNGVRSSRSVNSQGKVVSITDAEATADASSVSYQYDPWDNLTQTTDAAGNVTAMAYDLRGRKTQLIDPDMGTWNYSVDNLGQVTSQLDAKLQTTSFTYDVLGRLTRRFEPDLDSRWYFETNALGAACNKGIGKLCEATTTNGYFRRNTYDNLARLSSQTSHVDADYTAQWSYDPAGRLNTQTYPATVGAFPTPLGVKYNYTPLGLLQSVANNATGTPWWTRNAENADGNVTIETYGNGLIGSRSYDALMGRLVTLQAGPGGSPGAVQNQRYHYDNLGRLDQRQDDTAGVATSETFSHDNLNRLVAANLTAPGTGTQTTSVAFNAIGNLVNKSGVGTYAYNASGPASVRPHAVSGVSGMVNGVANPGYGYDANGNMLTDGARSFAWTSFNMPATLTKAAQAGSPGAGSATFLYGPEHQRVKQTWVDGAKTLTTVYLSEPLFEKEVNSQTGLTEFKHYVRVGTSVVAVHTRRSNATEDVRYLIPDHLGSTSVVTDAAGAVIDRQAFDPWGDRRVASGAAAGAADPTNLIQPTSTTRGFTGHEQLDQGSMGLTHMNGRVYDPTLGRFISADPNVQAPYSSQSFNRYSYLWNAPLSGTDPSGFRSLFGTGNGTGRDWFYSIVGAMGFGAVIEGFAVDIVGYQPEQSSQFANGFLSGAACRASKICDGSIKDPRPQSSTEWQSFVNTLAYQEGIKIAGPANSVNLETVLVNAKRSGAAIWNFMDGGYGNLSNSAFASGNYWGAAGYTVSATAYLGMNVAMFIPAATVSAARSVVSAVAAKGIAADAKFAQKTYGAMFSAEGKLAGKSVDEVAAALRSGAMSPGEVSVNYIVRDGQTIMLNTRSAQALEAAGIPRSQWNGVDQTGNSFFEGLLNGQLGRNPGGPFDAVRRTWTP